MIRSLVAILGLGLIAACTTVAPVPSDGTRVTVAPAGPRLSPEAAVNNFVAVVDALEPVAERECRQRARGLNCDFRITVDTRPNQPPNAFQSLDENGRPLIVFTIALIAEARNQDELAFVLGHEAAHHVAGHLTQVQTNATLGSVILGQIATLGGADAGTVETARQVGGLVGARRYSQEFELEADALGTIITERAGFDALRGAEFFFRLPDPAGGFLSTHPPNAARFETVRQTIARL